MKIIPSHALSNHGDKPRSPLSRGIFDGLAALGGADSVASQPSLRLRLLLTVAVLIGISAAVSFSAQTQLVRDNFFPAALEFKELAAVQSEKDVSNAADFARLEHAPVLLEAGLKRYSERIYAISGSGLLSISVMTLGDTDSAYSVFSILAPSESQSGPPGSFYSASSDTIIFVSGNYCALVRTAAGGDLARRVALSVANRIGARALTLPSLLRHLPIESCDSATARYLIGPQSAAAFAAPVGGVALKVPADVEVAQAHCLASGQTGTLSLIAFPTIALAEAYFDTELAAARAVPGGASLYARQTGPLVAILDGNLSPENADKTLRAIRFSYSIKWIYDKSNEQGHTIWGVPVKLLGTVVRSILFTVLLCFASILAGILIAAGRAFARKHGFVTQDGAYIRLKLDEN